MGEVINFMEYLQAKRQGITVKELRASRKVLEEALQELGDLGLHPNEYVEYEAENDSWPQDYPYVLEEDLDTGYHDECDHLEWSIVEEGYQATCNHCDLNAWSAPW
jgi:hypothetical protein